MPYDELIHYDHTQPDSHLAQIGLSVHQQTANPHSVMPPQAQTYHNLDEPLHMHANEPVVVTAPEKEITGTHSTLEGYVNKHTGQFYGGDDAARRANSGESPEGYLPSNRSDYLAAKKAGSYPLYKDKLTTNEGPEIPYGESDMLTEEKISQPGVAEGVAEHGSIENIADYEHITGKSLPVAEDVRKAVGNNMVPSQGGY